MFTELLVMTVVDCTVVMVVVELVTSLPAVVFSELVGPVDLTVEVIVVRVVRVVLWAACEESAEETVVSDSVGCRVTEVVCVRPGVGGPMKPEG